MRRTTSALCALVLAGGLAAAVPAVAADGPTDLLISEYVEGSSNNKALELFNGTAAAIDLAADGYQVQMFFNGSDTAGLTINLSGVVAAGDVFVLAHSSAAEAILAQADLTNGSGWFNGDDAVVLRKATTVVDSIGQVGFDPGTEWGSGLTSTADNTLRRIGNTADTDPTDSFDPAASWEGYPNDTFDGLGSHGGSTPTPTPTPTASPSPSPSPEPTVLRIGQVQGSTGDGVEATRHRSPLAPPSGNGTSAQLYHVRGVITQRTLARTSSGEDQHGFFMQSRRGADDGDPHSSDGIFVFMGRFTSLIGGYVPTVGDEVVLRARVSEYFNMTQLSSASLVNVLDTGVTDVAVTDAVPPVDLAEANRFWERHEGMRMRVRAGSGAVSGRDVFASTADAEIFMVDVADELLRRRKPFDRRVFRDPHPLDNDGDALFDDGNGNRIMLGSTGVKWTAQDNTAMLAPVHTFDRLAADAYGALSYGFNKYGIQVETARFVNGVNPAANRPPLPINRNRLFSVATYNVENLYDFRDDPFDGCDFVGNSGCPGVSPPFNYVPASEADYRRHLEALAKQIVADLHSPDLLLVQEAEDQDICSVSAGRLVCGTVDDADGRPDTLQELALAVAAAGGPAYDAAYDRDGADDRGIVAAFMYRTDRLSPADPASVLTASPGVVYRAQALGYNADVQNPKALNAVLPDDVDRSTGVDGANVYTRAPQVARFHVLNKPRKGKGFDLWAISNHFSSTPQARVGQRTEQARYGAAIVAAIEAADHDAKVVYGGDLNVFPRPDDPIAMSDTDTPSDQLGPLYESGMRNLWDELARVAPASAYSYVFQGQAQTLDHLFVNDELYDTLVRVRAAHVNADWAAGSGFGRVARGASDHDPQVAVFRSRGFGNAR